MIIATMLLSAAVGAILGWFFGHVRTIRMIGRLIAENEASPAPDDVKAFTSDAYIDVLREIGK